jgi:hypothetical protein
MLRLDLKKAPRWLELAPGVRIELLPANMKVMLAARRDPTVRAASEGVEDLDDEALEAHGDLALLLAQAVARRVVIGWEGVLDEDGRLAPVEPEYIDALLEHPAAFDAFQREYLAPAILLADEKNGSALSPSGTSAGAKAIARRASKTAPSARTGKNGRAASRAR